MLKMEGKRAKRILTFTLKDGVLLQQISAISEHFPMMEYKNILCVKEAL
jgi:hypothetical protein